MVKDWPLITIGDCFDFKNGLNKEKEYFGHGNPIINYMDVYKSSSICADDLKGKVELSDNEIRRYEVRKGDVFFTRTSETSKEVGLASVLLEDVENCTFSGFVLRARPKNDWLLPEYCKYCFSTEFVRKSIVEGCTYTTRALTNGTQLSKIMIPLPSKQEQQAIVKALSDIDNLISTQEALIDKKQAMKQGAMQVLLTGKQRVNGFTGKWVAKKLKDIAPLQRGFDLPVSSIVDGKFPVVFSNGINAWHNRFMVKGPGVVMGRSGTIGKISYVDEDYWPHNTSLWVTDFCGNYPKYVYYLFQTLTWDMYMSGSGVPTLNRNDVHECELIIPADLDEQVVIARILEDMDNEVTIQQINLEKISV